MREASLAIGRNQSYLHGFLERESPKVLSHQDAEKLAGLLGCEADELHHAERPPRRMGTRTKKRGRTEPDGSPMPLVGISEVEVEASAGPGAFTEEFVAERARWYLPEGMIRYEGGARPDAVRILRVRGVSMEPDLSAGDRLLVDITQRVPETGEMFVLWDGNGVVIKRVEYVNGTQELRLKSANPEYKDYTVPIRDVRIGGKVLWTVRRV